jgi:chlorite dismutase
MTTARAKQPAAKAAKPKAKAKATKGAKPRTTAKPKPAAKSKAAPKPKAVAKPKALKAAKAAPAVKRAAASTHGAHAPHHASPHHGAHTAPEGAAARPVARGVQTVKFSFYRVTDAVRAAPADERAAIGRDLRNLLDRSARRMLTRAYSTVGTRADVDFLVWQAHDDLATIMDWHAELLASDLGWALERPHSFLSMTMRSMYTNDLHEGAEKRDRLRSDGGQDDYLFVYPMAKTRAWYTLPQAERQRIMDEHIAIGHRYHGIKINTTYSYGLDDQEFVVAFEGNDPGEFLALVRELRDSESSSYTLFDTPMFTCRRVDSAGLLAQIGLAPAERA